MGLGYTPAQAYDTTWPEYLTYIISTLPPQEPVDDVKDVKAKMRKRRDAARSGK